MPRAIAALEQLRSAHLEARQPATPLEIVDALGLIASTIQVELPNEDGLGVYVALLGHLPTYVLKQALTDVLKTHTYRTMPLPAEFLATQPAKYWKATDIWLEDLCAKHLRHLRQRQLIA